MINSLEVKRVGNMHLKLKKLACIPAVRVRSIKTKEIYFLSISLWAVIFITLAGCSGPIPQPISPTSKPENKQQTVSENKGNQFKSPEILSLRIYQSSLLATGLSLIGQAKVLNPNPISINVDNPTVTAQGLSGTKYNEDILPDGQIAAISAQTFGFNIIVPTDAFNEQKLNIDFNFKTPSANATLPVSADTDFDILKTVNSLYVKPKPTLQANIFKVSWNGIQPQLETQVGGSINNPNPFPLTIDDIHILIKDNSGRAIASGAVPGASMAANSDYPFQTDIHLPIGILNSSGFTVSADAPAEILYSMFSFKGTATMQIPKLKDIIEIPQIALDTESSWTATNKNPSLEILVTATITNNNPFDLTTGALNINVYNSENTLLGSTSTPVDVIKGIPRSDSRTLLNRIVLTPKDAGLIPSDATVTANIEFGLENISDRVPVSASIGYQLVPEGW